MGAWRGIFRDRVCRILIIVGMLSPGLIYNHNATAAGFATAAILGFLLGIAWILWTARSEEKGKTLAQELGFYGGLFAFMTGTAHLVAHMVAR